MNTIHVNSINDPLLEPYRDLRHGNATRRTDWFVAEGKLVVRRLLKSDYQIRSILLSKKRTAEFESLIPAGTTVLAVDHEFCSQLVGFNFHAGVMACADRRLSGLTAMTNRTEQSLLVCCPETSLPDNMGSIIRLAASFSASGLITGPRSTDPFSRRSVRVSMGNIFGLDIFQPPDLGNFLTDLKQQFGFEIVAGEQTPNAEPLDRFAPAERTVLLLGNEAHGLDCEWLDLCDRAVQIEMSPEVDSLNVSTAAAIMLYGIRKRLGTVPRENNAIEIHNTRPADKSPFG